MKKNNRVLIVSVIMICSLLVGCGSKMSKDIAIDKNYEESNVSEDYTEPEKDYNSVKYDEAVENANTEENGMSETSTYDNVEEPNNIEGQVVANNRKIIKTVSMSLETQKFNEDVNLIEDKINVLGGYIESQNMNDLLSVSSRSCLLVARIPADKLDEFVNTVSKTGNVVSKNLSTDDVTLNYVDTESRVKVLKAEQERLLALIEDADTMEAIITLESRLTDIRYELESNESQLRMYDNLVDYSTVNISISEVYHYTPKVEKEQSTWKRMTTGLKNTLKNIKESITEFSINVVTDLPYIVIFVLFVLVIIIIIKIVNKKINKKTHTRVNMNGNINNNMNMYANTSNNTNTNTDIVNNTNQYNNEQIKDNEKNM